MLSGNCSQVIRFSKARQIFKNSKLASKPAEETPGTQMQDKSMLLESNRTWLYACFLGSFLKNSIFSLLSDARCFSYTSFSIVFLADSLATDQLSVKLTFNSRGLRNAYKNFQNNDHCRAKQWRATCSVKWQCTVCSGSLQQLDEGYLEQLQPTACSCDAWWWCHHQALTIREMLSPTQLTAVSSVRAR